MNNTAINNTAFAKEIVRPGYKKTKLGWIPEEWSLKKLNSLGEIYTGGTPSTTKNEYWDGDILWYTPTEITKSGKYINDSIRKISELGLKNSSAKLFDKGTIVVCTRATIGQLAISTEKATTNQGFKNLKVNSENDTDFIYYKLLSEKRRFISKSCGSTFLELSTTEFRNFKIAIPPLPEQQKIASILNTWDKAIAAQEQLIAQKQELKKGLMQALLTGKKRFDGFNEEWEEVRLKNILEYEQPTKYLVKNKNYSEEYNTPVLTANKSFVLGFTNEKSGVYDKLPIILFDDFTTDNKWVDFKFKVKSSAIKILKLKNKNFDLRFIYERMQLLRLDNTDHKRHYISEYQYLKFDCPGLKEQQKISNTIKESQELILKLENQLGFLKKQKQGLMQQLLTGEKRVKV